GKVHQGFLDAFLAAWGRDSNDSTPLRDRVKNRGNKKIWIAGHSLGGALAQLCAAHVDLLGIPVEAVYTFGQPRVGDETFAKNMHDKLGKRTYRLVNDRDI